MKTPQPHTVFISWRNLVLINLITLIAISGAFYLGLRRGSSYSHKGRALKLDERYLASHEYMEELRPPICAALKHSVTLPPTRSVKDTESFSLVINLKNEDEYHGCNVLITLMASGFELGPSETRRALELAPSESRSTSWLLTAKKTGTFDIAVVVNTDGYKMGITVTNVVGLTAFETFFLAILGFILGSMLTIPWWVERFGPKVLREGNEKKEENLP